MFSYNTCELLSVQGNGREGVVLHTHTHNFSKEGLATFKSIPVKKYKERKLVCNVIRTDTLCDTPYHLSYIKACSAVQEAQAKFDH